MVPPCLGSRADNPPPCPTVFRRDFRNSRSPCPALPMLPTRFPPRTPNPRTPRWRPSTRSPTSNPWPNPINPRAVGTPPIAPNRVPIPPSMSTPVGPPWPWPTSRCPSITPTLPTSATGRLPRNSRTGSRSGRVIPGRLRGGDLPRRGRIRSRRRTEDPGPRRGQSQIGWLRHRRTVADPDRRRPLGSQDLRARIGIRRPPPHRACPRRRDHRLHARSR